MEKKSLRSAFPYDASSPSWRKLQDIADNFGNRTISRWAVALVVAAAAAMSGQNPLHGRQGWREIADSMTSSSPKVSAVTPVRRPISLARLPEREPR